MDGVILRLIRYFANMLGYDLSKSHHNEEITQNDYEKSIPIPYIVSNGEKVVYENEKFKTKFGTNLGKESKLFMPKFEYELQMQLVTIFDKYYTVYNEKQILEDEKSYNFIYFFEVEDPLQISSSECEKVLVSLVFIDNYEEVLDTVEESRRPLLTAVIDRRLNALAQQIGGIIKKFEKDKYIFLFYHKKLDYLKKRKFDILDQIRDIDMGNKIPVTLTIGIGLGGESLGQSMEYARAAIDLALGRGGDQVLLKDSEKYYFFGGKAKEVGSNTRVRARVKAYALTELIEEASDVIIMGHRNSDLDCIGSGIGVYKIVTSLGRRCNIVLNNVTTNIKVLYNRLSEIKEYRENVFIGSDEALSLITETTLLIIVDTHRPSIMECPELLQKASKVVVFDHHRKSAEFVDNPVLTYHEPYASSTSELITEMMLYTKVGIKLLPVEADALLAGITVDTKNFAFKTGAKTFEAAAFLKRNGGDTIRVRLLFQSDLISYKAKVMAVNNAEIFNENMAISICDGEIENPPLTTAQAADELLNISGIVASFVLCKNGENILISARSLGDVNVQMIMERLGGGGHQTVAGAQVKNQDFTETIVQLKKAIMSH